FGDLARTQQWRIGIDMDVFAEFQKIVAQDSVYVHEPQYGTGQIETQMP
ncbi:TPA: hypothetical protein SAP42_004645, partial [Burkholderia multivorans]|nr:hypothetical protein [Burkholderia multivorans]